MMDFMAKQMQEVENQGAQIQVAVVEEPKNEPAKPAPIPVVAPAALPQKKDDMDIFGDALANFLSGNSTDSKVLD
jgi:hypothetical protein